MSPSLVQLKWAWSMIIKFSCENEARERGEKSGKEFPFSARIQSEKSSRRPQNKKHNWKYFSSGRFCCCSLAVRFVELEPKNSSNNNCTWKGIHRTTSNLHEIWFQIQNSWWKRRMEIHKKGELSLSLSSEEWSSRVQLLLGGGGIGNGRKEKKKLINERVGEEWKYTCHRRRAETRPNTLLSARNKLFFFLSWKLCYWGRAVNYRDENGKLLIFSLEKLTRSFIVNVNLNLT